MDKGAHFYRCDFQVHTPRDIAWSGNSYVTDEERLSYAKLLVAACRAKRISGIAITDHHDLCFFKYIKQAANEEKTEEGEELDERERLTVFPGIELTLDVPCQAILILDSDFELTLLDQVITILTIEPSPHDSPRTAEVNRLSTIKSFKDLKAKLDELSFLTGKYIVLPNVTSGGSDTLLRKGMAVKYSEMPCVGGYLDGSISKCKEGDLNILNGEVSAYGNRKLALFQTSDSRSVDHALLGSHSTWVKWSTPTAEAIRQACLASESRISQIEPLLPSIVIRSIHVSNSEFLGPINLELNPQYTALIGSRGTGKSTILEYLRWALCDEHQEESRTESKYISESQKNLIANTLTPLDSVVDIDFEVNGVRHLIRRESKTGEVLLKIGGGELETCSEDDVRTLLRIQAYSQKQLSRVGGRLDELNNFVESGIKVQLESIAVANRSTESKIRKVFADVRRKQVEINSINDDKLTLESLTKQAKSIRDALTGLSGEQQVILGMQPSYLAADIQVQKWTEELAGIRNTVTELYRSLDHVPSEISTELKENQEFEILTELKSVLDTQFSNIKQLTQSLDVSTEKMISDDGKPIGALEPEFDKWSKKRTIFEDKYSAAKSAASSHTSQLTILADLDSKIREISERISRSVKEIGGMGSPEEEFEKLIIDWQFQYKSKGELLEQQCEELTNLSEGAIKATALRGVGVEAVESRLKSTIKGSGIRTQKIETILSNVVNSDDPSKLWNDILGELKELAYIKVGEGE